MTQINLLPTDLAPRPKIIRASLVVKQILTVGFILFIILAVAVSIFYYLYSRDLKLSQTKVAEIKGNIKSLEVTEQRLLLVKDRLDKAKLVLGMDSTFDEIEAASTLFSSLPEEETLSSAQFEVDKSKMLLTSPNTTTLNGVIASVISSGVYKYVDMTSFSFTPETGFNVEFTLIK